MVHVLGELRCNWISGIVLKPSLWTFHQYLFHSTFQVRGTQCVVRFRNVTKPVDQSLCLDAGLDQPAHIQECGTFDCAKWHTNAWSSVRNDTFFCLTQNRSRRCLVNLIKILSILSCQCDECIGHGSALQRREIKCILSNGTELEVSHCDNSMRPADHQQCANHQCMGIWVTGEWSDVIDNLFLT